MPHRISIPAPRRVWQQTEQGQYASHAYTEADILRTLAGGGWFNFHGGHDFADRGVAAFAAQAQFMHQELLA